MSHKVLVVEANPELFNRWEDPTYGLGAQLEVLGMDGDDAILERIDTSADLLELATEIKQSEHLPARALVFQDVTGTDLSRNPISAFFLERNIEEPADYDSKSDPVWVWRGDEGKPLAPYSRFISSRLVLRALPDVRYYPDDGVHENWDEKYRDIFHWAYAGMGYDELRPTYEGFLARVNKSLSITGNDFMSIVDTVGSSDFGIPTVVEGADIDLRYTSGLESMIDLELPDYEAYSALRRIGLVAKLIKGEYPGATPEFDDINYILPRKESSDV